MDISKPKRRKVTLACDPCRSRKIKCDGHQPVCEPCEKRPGSEALCTWATDSLRTGHAPKDYIKHLEDRISLLEESNRQGYITQTNNNRSMNGVSDESIPRTTTREVTSSSLPEPTTRQRITSAPSVGSSSIPGTSTGLQPSTSATFIVPGLVPSLHPESTDTVFISNNHSVHDTIEDDNHSKESVGCPIARTFMQEVERLVKEKLGGTSQSASNVLGRSHDNPSPLVPGYELKQKDLDYTLPAREQADSLLSSYWKYVHILYPFLDKSQMEEDYDKIWDHGDAIIDRQLFLCLLNAAFAISSRHVRSANPDPEHLAATFCLRARKLLDIGICSISSVQSYLLLALYFESTDESHMCWMFVGLAIRTAQTLELHVFETSERQSESRTRDLLRKVWHGCILMDREVSMLYGRSCMIDPKTAAAVPLPLLIEEEGLRLGDVRLHTIQVQQTHAADFYISSLGLYDILHDVLLNFYSNESQRRHKIGHHDSRNLLPFEKNTTIFELQGRLSKWEKGIPDHLKVGNHTSDNGVSAVLVRRAIILHQRHLHIHILLLRPMLAAFIAFEFQNKGESVPFGSLLSHRISLQCAIVCVRIAQEAIDTIYIGEAAGSNETRDLSTWWCNAIFLYTSATVLIAGSLSPSVVAEISEESIHDGFHKAVAVLSQYAVFNTSFHRLVVVLHILFQIIPQKYTRLRQASQRGETNTELPPSNDANTAATFQFWCPVKQFRRTSSHLHDLKMHSNSEKNNLASSQLLSNLDLLFDPDDFTWLMKMPFRI